MFLAAEQFEAEVSSRRRGARRGSRWTGEPHLVGGCVGVGGDGHHHDVDPPLRKPFKRWRRCATSSARVFLSNRPRSWRLLEAMGLRFDSIDVGGLELFVCLRSRDRVVIDLQCVAAVPEHIVLDGSHECAVTFAVTLSPVGRQSNALRRVHAE